MLEHNFEKESTNVADKIMNGSSTEAAESLSQALLPMDHDSYNDFLQTVKDKTVPGKGNILDLDLENNLARLWSTKEFQPDYVIVTPGQNLTKICKSDLGQTVPAEKITQKAINSCIDAYVKTNELADPNVIMAGKTLEIPFP